MLKGWHSIPLNGVTDPASVFSDNNRDDIFIEIGLPNLSEFSLRFVIQQQRDTSNFFIKIYRGQQELTFSPESSDLQYDWKLKRFNAPPYGWIDWAPVEDFFEVLRGMMYLGPFRNVLNQGAPNHFDLSIGTNFVAQWAQWKTGDNRRENRIIGNIEADIRKILALDSLTISTSPDNTQFHVLVDDRPYKLNELGSGISQLVITFGNVAIRRPTFILIDEPELGLHPSLQIEFLTALASYASRGVIFSTHSIGLARSTAERIFTVNRSDRKTLVRHYESQRNLVEFLGELGYTNLGDLATTNVLLVEGVEDVKTIQQILRKLKKDSQVILLPLGGDAMLNASREVELLELTRLSKNISCLIDSERDIEGAPLKKNRADFVALCQKLKITIHVLERRATENYFTDRAIKLAIAEGYKALKPFQKLKEGTPWGKGENWKIARELSLEEIETTDLGKFLASI